MKEAKIYINGKEVASGIHQLTAVPLTAVPQTADDKMQVPQLEKFEMTVKLLPEASRALEQLIENAKMKIPTKRVNKELSF